MRSTSGVAGLFLWAASGALWAGRSEAQSIAFKGIVRDSATNQPINGAVLEFASSVRSYAARTDEGGTFEIAEVEPGTYRARIRRIGYAPASMEIAVGAGMKALTVRLAVLPQSLKEIRVYGKGSGIYGRIATSNDLSPIPGAKILVAGSRDSTVTDSTGAYFMPLKRPGQYMVRVQAQGFADEMFIVDVKRNAIADGSGLLDEGEGRRIPGVLWKDFDQRSSWRTVNGGALIGGSELRNAGSDLVGALQMSGSMAAHGVQLKVGVCVFVDGEPSPGFLLHSLRLEDVRAVEFYRVRTDSWRLLMRDWPRGARCSPTGAPLEYYTYMDGAIVIWTR